MESVLNLLNEISLPVGTLAVIAFGWQLNGKIGGLQSQMYGMEKRVDTHLSKVDADIADLRMEMRGLRDKVHDVDKRLQRIEAMDSRRAAA